MDYYRRVKTPINDLKYKMQIAALALNMNKNKNDINEIDKKFDDYYNNVYIDNSINRLNRLINIFNENLTNHIDNYELNVPNNLKSDIAAIKDEIDNLPENLDSDMSNIKSDITNIKNKIPNNLKFDITAIKNQIDNLPENLDNEITNIKNDLEIQTTNMLLYLNKTDVNKEKLDTHTDIINSNFNRLDKIKYNIDDIYILKIDEVKDLNFTSTVDKIEIFNALFNSTNFKTLGYIELFAQFLFKYPNYNTIGRFSLLFEFYNQNDDLFKKFSEPATNSGDNNEELINKKCFYALRLLDDYDQIRVKIYVSRINKNDFETLKIKMINTTESNKLILKYIRYND